MTNLRDVDVLVAGAGPAGLAAALAVARLGLGVTVVTLQPAGGSPPVDRRTAALFGGSITLLRNLGVWDACAGASAPINGIRIVDDTAGLLRAPEVLFTAAELGRDVFGYNVPNAVLTEALGRALDATPSARLAVTARPPAIAVGPDRVQVAMAEGETLAAPLLVGADGRGSPARAAAGIGTKTWTYPQTALVTTFRHSRPHDGISSELHRLAGPLTTVPMPGSSSSLVWVETPEEVQRLCALSDARFLAELEERLQGLLGGLSELTPRAAFPLSGLSVDTAGANRVALVGEAAHVIPPIGAQGLNLGLRDAATLADVLADALERDADIGGPDTLAAYAAARSGDIATRITGVDLLNRTLIAGLLPTHLARGIGLHLLKMVGPLRRKVVAEGLQPSSAEPNLMRPGGAAELTRRLTPVKATSAT
jgi:2-octaprenyl-6-methoxyphenol hydroxylase